MDPEPSSKGVASAKKRLVTRFTHCDALSAHGPISSMTFALAKNGVSYPRFILERKSQPGQERFVPELVAATGSRHLGGFSLFQVCGSLDSGDFVEVDVPVERSPYQGETEGACCGRGSWNVGISDQAVRQGKRRLIRSAFEPVPLRE